MTKEAEELQRQLNQTEEELKQLKDRAGVISLAETQATLATELAKAQEDLDAAEGELAAQQARVKELETSLAMTSTRPTNTRATTNPPTLRRASERGNRSEIPIPG